MSCASLYGAVGWSAVCDCGISYLYSLAFSSQVSCLDLVFVFDIFPIAYTYGIGMPGYMDVKCYFDTQSRP